MLDYNLKDKFLVQGFLKECTQTNNIGFNIPKIIVILHADRLTCRSQLILKYILDKNYKTSRFIFITTHFNKLIEALRSRCFNFRQPLPTRYTLNLIMNKYAQQGGINLEQIYSDEIIDLSMDDNQSLNIRNVINTLELCYIRGEFIPFLLKYKEILIVIVNKLQKLEFDMNDFLFIREHIIKLYVNNVETNIIIKFIVNKLIQDSKLSDDVKAKITTLAAEVEHKSKIGNKDIIHLETLISGLVNIFISDANNKPVKKSKKSSKKNDARKLSTSSNIFKVV